MKLKKYIKQELQKELEERDRIAEHLADESEEGIILQFIKAVNNDDVKESRKITEQQNEEYMNAVNNKKYTILNLFFD